MLSLRLTVLLIDQDNVVLKLIQFVTCENKTLFLFHS